MILFHGSNLFVQEVELQRCKPFKDFGRGFYCTTIKAQAELMAKRVAALFGSSPCVSLFELNQEIFCNSGLKIRSFKRPSREWALFVLNNRNRSFPNPESMECNHDNKYDLVIGPIANDDLALLFRTFTTGLIDLDALTKGMEFKKLTDQYSFHSDHALRYLKPLGGI